MYVYTQDVPINIETYWRVIDALGPEPLAGLLLHFCVRRPDGGLRYIEVWDSEAACGRAFDERIHGAVNKAFGGMRPSGEPTVDHLEVLHASGAMLAGVGLAELKAEPTQ
jgi:hypothetical protein